MNFLDDEFCVVVEFLLGFFFEGIEFDVCGLFCCCV